MSKTPLLQFDKPTEEQEPWWDFRDALDDAFDRAIYSVLEMENTVLVGGGTLAFDGTNFSWNAALELLNLVTGIVITIPAGSIAVPDGTILYVSVARPLTANVPAAPILTANTLSADFSKQWFAVRRGAHVYLLNGTKV
jgi:hypothetical protein